MPEENNLIDPTFVLECSEPDDKHFKQFSLFLNTSGCKKWVNSLRKKSKINIKDINARLNKYKNFLKNKKIKGAKDYWDNFSRYVSFKLKIDDVYRLLKIVNQPLSWQYPLSCYILTGKIITPSSRYSLDFKKDRIILETYGDTTVRDVRDAYKRVNKLPFARRHHEFYPWLMPVAFESFNFDGFDIVVQTEYFV